MNFPTLRGSDVRRLARANAAARSALGIVALTLPGMALAPWVGGARRDPAARLLARALGGRDLAIGVGALQALRAGGQLGPWALAGGLADAGDVVVTLLSWRALPRRGRLAVLAAASGGVLAAALVTTGLARDPE